MTEVHVIPASLGVSIDDYFATITDGGINTSGIGPCIGGLFYRQGHVGLGHFNPSMEAVMHDMTHYVQPRMLERGSGDVGCRLFTGQSFATLEELQGEQGVDRYFEHTKKIEELGFIFDEDGSRTYMLANHGPMLLIQRLQARLTGKDLERVEVHITYLGPGESDSIEESLEEFEIDTRTMQTKVLQPFTGHCV